MTPIHIADRRAERPRDSELPPTHALGPRDRGLSGAADRPVDRAPRWPRFDGYEILGELGRGGMGVVYQARQASLNRVAALKVVLGGAFADPDHLARFRREAGAVARLQHPTIVQIFEVGVRHGSAGDNLFGPFICLEYVEGGNLARAPGWSKPSPGPSTTPTSAASSTAT